MGFTRQKIKMSRRFKLGQVSGWWYDAAGSFDTAPGQPLYVYCDGKAYRLERGRLYRAKIQNRFLSHMWQRRCRRRGFNKVSPSQARFNRRRESM